MRKFYLLLMMMGISLVSQAQEAVHDFAVDNIYYQLLEKHFVAVSGLVSTQGDISTIEIPDEVTSGGETYYVSAVADNAFRGTSKIKNVYLSNDTKSIGRYAFAECSDLQRVYVGGNLREIGSDAFVQCENLKLVAQSATRLLLPETLTFIGARAFAHTALTQCPIDGSNTDLQGIDQYAFSYTQLTTFYVPQGIEVLSYALFAGSPVTHLIFDAENMHFLSSKMGLFATLNDRANTTLKKVTIGPHVAHIPDSLCCGLDKVEIIMNGSAESIGKFAFKDCRALNTNTMKAIGMKTETIGESAFENCENMTNPLFDKATNLKTIGPRAFAGCKRLWNGMFYSVESIGDEAFLGTNIADILLPENLLVIGRDAFKDCNSEGTTEGAIGQGIKGIARVFCTAGEYFGGLNAFNADNCPNLETVNFIGDIETIPVSAFSGTGVKEIIFSSAVKNIGSSAFSNCPNLKTLRIPKGITRIGNKAFANTGMQTLIFDCQEMCYIESYAFQDNMDLEHIIVHGAAPTFERYAFRGCDNLKDVTGTCKNTVELQASDLRDLGAEFITADSNYDLDLTTFAFLMEDKGEIKVLHGLDCEGVCELEAVPFGWADCEFYCWSDGNMENPRTIDLKVEEIEGPLYAVFVGENDLAMLDVESNAPHVVNFSFSTSRFGERPRPFFAYDFDDATISFDIVEPQYQFVRWEYDDPFNTVQEDPETHALYIPVFTRPHIEYQDATDEQGMEPVTVYEYPQTLKLILRRPPIEGEFVEITAYAANQKRATVEFFDENGEEHATGRFNSNNTQAILKPKMLKDNYRPAGWSFPQEGAEYVKEDPETHVLTIDLQFDEGAFELTPYFPTTFMLNIEKIPDAIHAPEAEAHHPAATIKVLEHGHIIIVHPDGSRYSTSGVRMKNERMKN